MLESLKLHLTRDIDKKDLRVIILRAAGPVFSAGHDLKELVSKLSVGADVFCA
jgi:enoyl-CoA hydratase/carnithine racemase